MPGNWRNLTLRDFGGPVVGKDPRMALMWPPTRHEVAAIVAAARAVAAEPRVLDAGAGSGLLAQLLSDAGLHVTAVDPGAGAPLRGRFFPVEAMRVEDVEGAFDLGLVSWMEAGLDYRAAVAERCRVIVQARDTWGGCGVQGDTNFESLGFTLAHEWATPSWENVDHAYRTRGRNAGGRSLPHPHGLGNVLEVWARPQDVEAVGAAVTEAEPGAALPWEPEMETLTLT